MTYLTVTYSQGLEPISQENPEIQVGELEQKIFFSPISEQVGQILTYIRELYHEALDYIDFAAENKKDGGWPFGRCKKNRNETPDRTQKSQRPVSPKAGERTRKGIPWKRGTKNT